MNKTVVKETKSWLETFIICLIEMIWHWKILNIIVDKPYQEIVQYSAHTHTHTVLWRNGIIYHVTSVKVRDIKTKQKRIDTETRLLGFVVKIEKHIVLWSLNRYTNYSKETLVGFQSSEIAPKSIEGAWN